MRRLLVRMGLRFENPQDEAAFVDRYVLRHLRAIQLLGLATGALQYSFTFVDRILYPVGAGAAISHTIRLLTFVFIVGMAAAVQAPALRRRLELVMTATMAVIAGSIALLDAVSVVFMDAAPVPDEFLGLWSLPFVTMVVAQSSLFPSRFVYLLAGNGCILAAAAGLVAPTRPSVVTVVGIISVLTAVAIGVVGAARREQVARREWRLMREVEVARARIQDLLHTMLPADVARRIQAGATAVADDHAEVAIVFADLVGFTALSRQISAAQLVDLLNGIFSAIDRLAERHGVERIKTIGDCYMGASGLAPGAGDPARAAADFALALPAVVAEASRVAGHPLEARVGLHVGPVVAGVIGVQRPAFDCWGASVNLASRLETAATPGQVLISEAACRRLGSDYAVTPLAPEDLKGFGPTPVYRLEARAG